MSSRTKMQAFIEAVRASQLLPAPECVALTEAADREDCNPEQLARNLVDRKLLTAYQVRKLWRGQGADLVLGPYILLDKIGEGGMGEVFHAKQTRLDRDVALKIIRRERLANPSAVRRFRREIRAAAALAHDNVVLAYDADQVGDIHFFAMEYVDGTNLDRLVHENGRRPVPEACDYVQQIARGLQHAHERGLIHRDIKPSNLLLSKSGIVKISDLGLARVDDPEAVESGSRLTKEGLSVGTPDFVAPEQARNAQAADIRSDIYSLGCTFYYLLAGELPYPGGTATEKMLRQTREPLASITRDDLPAPVAAILRRMTEKNPDDRFQTPEELVEVLEPFVPKKTQTFRALPTAAMLALPGSGDDTPEARREPKTDSQFKLPSSANVPVARRKNSVWPMVSIVLGGVLLIVAALVVAALVGKR